MLYGKRNLGDAITFIWIPNQKLVVPKLMRDKPMKMHHWAFYKKSVAATHQSQPQERGEDLSFLILEYRKQKYSLIWIKVNV